MSLTDLILPLSRHDLCIHSADVDAGIQAHLVVDISDVTTNSTASTCSSSSSSSTGTKQYQTQDSMHKLMQLYQVHGVQMQASLKTTLLAQERRPEINAQIYQLGNIPAEQ